MISKRQLHMQIRRPHPAGGRKMTVYLSAGRSATHDMRFDAQTIKLLLVITPRFCRIVGDEEDAFPYNKGEGSDRTQVRPNAGEGEGWEDDDKYDTSAEVHRYVLWLRSISRNSTTPSMRRSPCQSTPSQSNIQVSYFSRSSRYLSGLLVSKRTLIRAANPKKLIGANV
jgi:hypothetical protein